MEERRAETRYVSSPDVPDGWMALDIGPSTAEAYAARIATVETVFWSGPKGRFEFSQFAAGTRAIADAVASTSGATVVAGGETAQALQRWDLLDNVSHVSSGGPATLAFIEGRVLPAVQVLLRNGTDEYAVAPRP